MSDRLSSDLASLRIDRTPPSEQPGGGRGRTFLIVVMLLGVIASLGAFAYPYLRSRIWKTEVITTEIALISPAQASILFSSTGYVVPQTISKVAAKLQGRIAHVAAREGDQVRAGDLLVTLEDADLRSQIRAAESRVLVAKARAQAARASLAEVRQQAERERVLVEQGVAPKAPLQDLDARALALTEAARAAEAEIAAVQSDVDTLRTNLQYTKIVSPIDGTVVSKPGEVGELVGPMLGGQGAIVEIADFRTLLVETDVPESRLARVQSGAPCEVVLDAYPERRFRGRSVEIGKRVNRAKATIPVKVQFVDAAEGVLPDMAARVSFLNQELSAEAMKEASKVIVPAAAVVERAGRKVVFALADGKVRETPVVLGPALGHGFVLTQGPPPGARVVSEPPAQMKDGDSTKEKP